MAITSAVSLQLEHGLQKPSRTRVRCRRAGCGAWVAKRSVLRPVASFVVNSARAKLVGLISSAITVAVGISSCSSSSRFGTSSPAQGGRACDVAARTVQAGDKSKRNRVACRKEHNRDGRGRCLRGQCRRRAARCSNHPHLVADQIGSQGRQSIVLALRRTIFDRNVPTLHIARFAQPFAEQTQMTCEQSRELAAEKSDHRHCRLLRTRPATR